MPRRFRRLRRACQRAWARRDRECVFACVGASAVRRYWATALLHPRVGALAAGVDQARMFDDALADRGRAALREGEAAALREGEAGVLERARAFFAGAAAAADGDTAAWARALSGVVEEWAGNAEAAAALYRQAADLGVSLAQGALAAAYRFGRGVPRDADEAARWYAAAAERGHPDAQNALGKCYAGGTGVRARTGAPRARACDAPRGTRTRAGAEGPRSRR